MSSDQGTAKAAGSITVIGDHVEFAPGTDAEQPWLFDTDGSQFDGEGRFTDGGTHATYRFQLPADVQGGTLTLDIANQFLVEASTDNQTWTTVLKEDAPIRDRSNRSERTLDLNALRGGARTLYLRLGDSQPDDGWGGWLARVELDLQRGGRLTNVNCAGEGARERTRLALTNVVSSAPWALRGDTRAGR